MNILGFQSQILTSAHGTMARATWPSTLKCIVPGGLDAGLLREWRQHRPDGLLILRHFFPDEQLDPAKIDQALNAADQIADLHPIVECPINESSQTSPDAIARLSDYSVRFVQQATAAGLKAAVGVFSEGNPSDLSWWTQFHPALRAARAAGGYLALHEYGLPGLGMEDWHLLRHRRVWEALPEDCRLPILVTECGIDGGIEGRREVGWRGYMDARQYGQWLDTYHAELARDPYVHGATVFLCGGNDQWRLFDVTDEVDLRPALTRSLEMAPRWTPAPIAPTEDSPMVTLRGIDVSNNNGAIGWAAVKAAGYAFAGMKASGDEGSTNHFLDSFFPQNWSAAGAQGLVRMAYHYARPSVVSPARSVTTLEEAINAAGGLRTGDLVVLDLEDPAVSDGTSLHLWAAEWLGLAERVFGVAPVKYSARYYTSTHDLEHPDLDRYPTWWAAYQPTKPAAVTGWTPIRIWQHSADATVPGVQGACDVNVFDGSVAELRALGKAAGQASVPAAGPVSVPAAGPVSVPAEVTAALDTLWNYAGPDVAIQRAIVDLKVTLGLQEAA